MNQKYCVYIYMNTHTCTEIACNPCTPKWLAGPWPRPEAISGAELDGEQKSGCSSAGDDASYSIGIGSLPKKSLPRLIGTIRGY